MHPSVRNGFEDLDRLEALGTCLWSSVRREASLCSWWKDRITELNMGLRPQFLTLICNVILEISRYAVDWSYWWTMQMRSENCSSEALKSTGRFHLYCKVLKQKYFWWDSNLDMCDFFGYITSGVPSSPKHSSLRTEFHVQKLNCFCHF